MKQIATWSSPANIALIKYWGKTGLQIPANPSLSMTLSESRTVTEIEMQDSSSKGGSWQFRYAGELNKEFAKKIDVFFSRIKTKMPFLEKVFLSIDSENNFPHSSGISSSASFMSSMALCLCDLESQFYKQEFDRIEIFQKASEIARLGSGSAARSIYGGFTIWGDSSIENSSNEYAIPINDLVHPVFKKYHDAILLVSSKPKVLSSTAGHELMNHNPFASARYDEAADNLNSLLFALKTGDQDILTKITEQEALTLHGLIMSSDGGPILMTPNTLEIINLIRDFRIKTGSTCCFTLDAGPNIHLLYPEAEKEQILKFVVNDLLKLCENQKWINDKIGSGPFKIT